MSRIVSRSAFLVLSWLGVSSIATGQPPVPTPNAESHDVLVCLPCNETVYRLVPETKPIKKTVYEAKRVPFCYHCMGALVAHGRCIQCKGVVRWKNVLVKREIICGEKTEMKYVAEPAPKPSSVEAPVPPTSIQLVPAAR